MLSSGIVIVGMVCLLGAPDQGGEQAPLGKVATEPIVLRRCTTDYLRSTLLGAPLPGILQDCLVQPGDRVKAGQILGRIQDQEVRAEIELRREQAESDVEIRMNEAKHERTQIRLKASESLHKRNMLSYDMLSVDRLDEAVARMELESAQLRRRLAQLQLAQSRVALGVREIVARHDGVVVAVLKQAGEAVTSVMPIFHVVDTDRILVAGSLDVQEASRVRRGQAVRVAPVVGGIDLEIERARFSGRITFISPLIDAKTQTCKVFAEVDNREGLLRAGLSARMEILAEEATEVGPGPVAGVALEKP
jgi:RND family efflux transporter MFP subunit